MTDDYFISNIKKLKLMYLEKNLKDFFLREGKNSPRKSIENLVELEVNEQRLKSTERRLRDAKLGKYKLYADFDWSWPIEVQRHKIERLFTLNFILEPSDAIFIGESGVGKTMLSKNLLHEAAIAGFSGLFVQVSEMISDLESQDSARSFKQRLLKYTKPKILVLDELGYLSYSMKAADILFQVISSRYEKNSTIVTTNKTFSDWGSIFPGATCVQAIVDRLTHRAEIIQITAKSYRVGESEKRKKVNRNKEANK